MSGFELRANQEKVMVTLKHAERMHSESEDSIEVAEREEKDWENLLAFLGAFLSMPFPRNNMETR